MSPIHSIEKFFRDHSIGDAHVLVAASGGTDSTALLLLLHENFSDRIRTSAVHLNHGLRGAESDADEQFVRALCLDHGIPLHVRPAPLDANETRSVGVEAAARRLRYDAFLEIREQIGAQFVATAHQKNDQAETVLMRLISGSGIERLGGIQPITDGGVIRPLLEVERKDLEAYLANRGVTPRQDQSNADERFLRNRIRSRLVPLLMEWNPAIVSTLSETALQAREQTRVVRNLILTEGASWISEFPDRTEFALENMPEDDWLVRAAIAVQIRRLDPNARDVSSVAIRRIAVGLSNPGRSSVTGRLEIVRTSDRVVLRRRTSPPAQARFALSLHPGEEVELPQLPGRVRLRSCAVSEPMTLPDGGEAQRFQIPPSALPEFVIRNRRSGDRFRPLGMSGQKKLTDFMIDRKIRAEERDRIPLLTWNGQVVWVPGVEISEDFKVRDGDHDIYEVRILFDR